ncbi:hypothetical protein SUGI_0596450 [Cryptomeria japonica]|nr:hypothetical protein SUGI_0596450 [Cryptomeria japonica]
MIVNEKNKSKNQQSKKWKRRGEMPGKNKVRREWYCWGEGKLNACPLRRKKWFIRLEDNKTNEEKSTE